MSSLFHSEPLQIISLNSLFLDSYAPNSASLQPLSSSKIHDMLIAASGGFGNVRKAVYKQNEATFINVALKFMNKKESDWENELVLKEFTNEMTIMEQKLTHPNLVKCYGKVIIDAEDPFGICLVYDFIEGSTLEQFVNTGKFQEQTLEWQLLCMRDLCKTMHYLHEKKQIIHCDLSTNNLLISNKENRMFLIDFGSSIFSSTQKFLQAPTGNARFCAPEVISKENPFSKQSDVFAFGVILKEVGILSKRFDDKPSFKERLHQLMISCLSQNNPSQRPTFKELSIQLQQIMDAMVIKKSQQLMIEIETELQNKELNEKQQLEAYLKEVKENEEFKFVEDVFFNAKLQSNDPSNFLELKLYKGRDRDTLLRKKIEMEDLEQLTSLQENQLAKRLSFSTSNFDQPSFFESTDMVTNEILQEIDILKGNSGLKRVILLGSASSGKTCLLRRLTYKAADAAMDKLRSKFDDKSTFIEIPIFISLYSMVVTYNNNGDLIKYFQQDKTLKKYPILLQYLRECPERLFLLLDGLDETRDARKAVVSELELFLKNKDHNQNMHVLISSRESGFDEEFFAQNNFELLQIQPLSVEHQRELAQKRLYFKIEHDSEYKNKEFEEQTRYVNFLLTQFERAILCHNRYSRIAKTPMMLSLLLATFLESKDQYVSETEDYLKWRPANRSQLYEKAIYYLIFQLENQRSKTATKLREATLAKLIHDLDTLQSSNYRPINSDESNGAENLPILERQLESCQRFLVALAKSAEQGQFIKALQDDQEGIWRAIRLFSFALHSAKRKELTSLRLDSIPQVTEWVDKDEMERTKEAMDLLNQCLMSNILPLFVLVGKEESTGKNLYRFTHLSFQEYLASQYLAKKIESAVDFELHQLWAFQKRDATVKPLYYTIFDKYIGHSCHDAWFQQMLLFVAGSMEETTFQQMAQYMIDRDDQTNVNSAVLKMMMEERPTQFISLGKYTKFDKQIEMRLKQQSIEKFVSMLNHPSIEVQEICLSSDEFNSAMSDPSKVDTWKTLLVNRLAVEVAKSIHSSFINYSINNNYVLKALESNLRHNCKEFKNESSRSRFARAISVFCKRGVAPDFFTFIKQELKNLLQSNTLEQTFVEEEARVDLLFKIAAEFVRDVESRVHIFEKMTLFCQYDFCIKFYVPVLGKFAHSPQEQDALTLLIGCLQKQVFKTNQDLKLLILEQICNFPISSDSLFSAIFPNWSKLVTKELRSELIGEKQELETLISEDEILNHFDTITSHFSQSLIEFHKSSALAETSLVPISLAVWIERVHFAKTEMSSNLRQIFDSYIQETNRQFCLAKQHVIEYWDYYFVTSYDSTILMNTILFTQLFGPYLSKGDQLSFSSWLLRILQNAIKLDLSAKDINIFFNECGTAFKLLQPIYWNSKEIHQFLIFLITNPNELLKSNVRRNLFDVLICRIKNTNSLLVPKIYQLFPIPQNEKQFLKYLKLFQTEEFCNSNWLFSPIVAFIEYSIQQSNNTIESWSSIVPQTFIMNLERMTRNNTIRLNNKYDAIMLLKYLREKGLVNKLRLASVSSSISANTLTVMEQSKGSALESESLSQSKYLITASSFENTIRVLKKDTGELVRQFHAFSKDEVTAIHPLPSIHMLLCGSKKGDLRAFNILSGICTDVQLQKSESQQHNKQIREILCMETIENFSQEDPDRTLLAVGSDDKTIRLFKIFHNVDSSLAEQDSHILTGECVVSLPGHNSFVWSLCTNFNHGYSQRQTTSLFSCSKSIIHWDLETCKPVNIFKNCHEQSTFCMLWNEEYNFLCSGGADDSIKFWDVRTGTFVNKYMGHNDWVKSMLIHPTDGLLYTASIDCTIKKWDFRFSTSSKQQFLESWEGHTDKIDNIVATSPSLICSHSEDDNLKLWNITSERRPNYRCVQTFKAKHGKLGFRKLAIL